LEWEQSYPEVMEAVNVALGEVEEGNIWIRNHGGRTQRSSKPFSERKKLSNNGKE